MEYWWVHILLFVFGYVTCKTFYFVRGAKLSITLLRASHIIYLSSLIKAIEHMSHAREMMLEHMIKTEKGGSQISFFEMKFEEDLRLFKERSIDVLLYCHPAFFKPTLEFDDWSTAMKFLQDNKQAALAFWNGEQQ
jgi:hypothetical protein